MYRKGVTKVITNIVFETWSFNNICYNTNLGTVT